MMQRKFKELQFRCVFELYENQTRIDLLFHELIGNKGLTPVHKNVGTNIDTLLALSQEIIELKKEKQKLQEENDKFRAVINSEETRITNVNKTDNSSEKAERRPNFFNKNYNSKSNENQVDHISIELK